MANITVLAYFLYWLSDISPEYYVARDGLRMDRVVTGDTHS